MNAIQEIYAAIGESMKSFESKVEANAERFFEFIRTHNTFGYVETSVPVYPEFGWDHAQFGDYKIVFDRFDAQEYARGVRYESALGDYFVMPYSYMDNPGAWEKAVFDRMEDDSKAAIEAMKTDFPGMLKEEDEKKVNFWRKEVRRGTYLIMLDLRETSLPSNDGLLTEYNGKHYLLEGGLGYNPLTGHIEIGTNAEEIFTFREGRFEPLVQS